MHVYILSFSLVALVPLCHGQQKVSGTESCSADNRRPKIVDRDIIYTYSTKVNRLQLECLASYPIEWDVHGREMHTVVRQRITTNGDIFKNPVKCYNSTLIVLQSEARDDVTYSRTGKYTCQSIQNKEISTSIYKFVHDHNLFAYPTSGLNFYNEQIESKEYLSVENGEFIIPCRSNIEAINASLVKIEPPKLYKLDMLNDYIRYEPKIGFLINSTKFPFNPVGDYECELTYRNEKRNALIHLKSYHEIDLPKYEAIPAIENVPFNDLDHTVTLNCRSNEEIYLAASNPETFQMFKNESRQGSFRVKEFNPVLHLQREQTFRYEVSAEITPKAMSSGQVFCKTTANNSLLHTWNYDLLAACDCDWNSSTLKSKIDDSTWVAIWQSMIPNLKGAIECKSRQNADLILSFHPCQNPTECKNRVFCDKEEQKYCKSVQSQYDTMTINALRQTVYLRELQSGVVECSVQGYGHRFQATADLTTIGFGNPGPQMYINITESEQFILKGDIQIFKCELATYFLSGDAKWAFQFKNKTFSFIDRELNQNSVPVGHKLVYTITLKIDDPEVAFLYCFAPVWNSTSNEWKNSSVPITVEDQDSEEYVENPTSVHQCLETKRLEKNKPSIIMERYTDVSPMLNVTTFWKASEKEFILRKRKQRKLISLICHAKYPVEWNFEGNKINTGFKLIESTMQNGDGNAKTMCFESKITIYDPVIARSWRSSDLYDSTGKYVCQSNHDKNLKSTTYIYKYYNSSFPLINHGQHLKLEIEKGRRQKSSWTVFPCRVTHPSVHVNLYMYTYDENDYTELKMGEKVKYDPTIGFSVQNSLLDFSGHYICSTQVKDTSHTISFSIVEKMPVIAPSRIDLDSGNKTKSRSRCRANRNGKSSKFLVVSITAAVLIVALVVVVLLLFREIINQKRTIRDLTNGLSVSYSQRLRESNPAFLEDIHIPESNHLVRPSSNYERF